MSTPSEPFSTFYESSASPEELSATYWNDIKRRHLGHEAYRHARLAVSDEANPMALLRLGRVLYFGVGTRRNANLAHYFYKQALHRGVTQAWQYIFETYADGTRHIASDFESERGEATTFPAAVRSYYRDILEQARQTGNYGILSAMRSHIKIFYPDYDKQTGISDFLNGRDTLHAQLFYSLSTVHNEKERHHAHIDDFMRQLCRPLTDDATLTRSIDAMDVDDVLRHDEGELYQALLHFEVSHAALQKRRGVEDVDIPLPFLLPYFPFIPMETFSMLRRQILRCLLTALDIDPDLRQEYLSHLHTDEYLVQICEKEQDEDMQLLLLSFVELQIDIETIQLEYLTLYRSYRVGNYERLCDYLNDYASTLTNAGVTHHLPVFTPDNLPVIDA